MSTPLSALGETGASHRRRPAPIDGVRRGGQGPDGRGRAAMGNGEWPATMALDEGDEPEEEEPAPEAKGHATGSGSIRDVRENEAEAIDTAATAILARGTSANPEDLVSAFGPGREPGLVRVGSMC